MTPWLADYKHHLAATPSYVFCSTTAQAQEAAAAIGPRAATWLASTPRSERAAARKAFEAGELLALCGTHALFNQPATRGGLVLRPTRTEMLRCRIFVLAPDILLDATGSMLQTECPAWYRGKIFAPTALVGPRYAVCEVTVRVNQALQYHAKCSCGRWEQEGSSCLDSTNGWMQHAAERSAP